jgi:hypothetical protein
MLERSFHQMHGHAARRRVGVFGGEGLLEAVIVDLQPGLELVALAFFNVNAAAPRQEFRNSLRRGRPA